MTDTSRDALIADLRLNHEYCPKEVMLQAADILEADAQQRSKPHGHCTHPKCKDIFGAYLEAMDRLAKYEPGATMHLNSAQQVAVPALTPLTPEQTHEALTAASVDTFYMTHAVTRKELWFTQGSTDVMSIVRAIERAHGIGAKP